MRVLWKSSRVGGGTARCNRFVLRGCVIESTEALGRSARSCTVEVTWVRGGSDPDNHFSLPEDAPERSYTGLGGPVDSRPSSENPRGQKAS